MLDEDIKSQLKSYLGHLTSPVELVATLDDSESAREMKDLLDAIVTLSDQITVVERANDNVRKPSFLITNQGVDSGLRFAGVPLGQEFTSLALALLQVGGYPPKESQEIQERVRCFEGKLHFETYYSITCHNCPGVVQALNLMTALNSNITHTAIDGALFHEEVEKRKIMGVPAVFLNGVFFGQGRMTLEEIINRLDKNATTQTIKNINQKKPFDVLVVGGGPAGATAAIYAARKGIRTGIVAERFGGQVLDTVDIENFISIPRTEGQQLAAEMERHVKHYGIDIVDSQRAKALIPGGDLIEIRLESGAALLSKTVILATGARWRLMNVPGEEMYRTKGVTFCPHCDGPLFKGKRVAVIGGGNSGVEAAIDLAGVVDHVSLLEFLPAMRADEVLQRKLRSLLNVDIIVNAQTTEVLGKDGKVCGLNYKNRETEEIVYLPLEGIFVQIGLLPNTDWLKETVALNSMGEIIIDTHGKTNIAGVFAAGDCSCVPYKQIVIAAGEGAKAALSAFDYLVRASA
ncbi:MAG: alkyl hydroperoxide reductase subunit F [Burkholderiales bacterium]|nr:alkyl hydroperoxide reductase subunit F [Burkholderiales bacterium]